MSLMSRMEVSSEVPGVEMLVGETAHTLFGSFMRSIHDCGLLCWMMWAKSGLDPKVDRSSLDDITVGLS